MGALQDLMAYFDCSTQDLLEFKKEDPEGFAQIKEGFISGALTY